MDYMWKIQFSITQPRPISSIWTERFDDITYTCDRGRREKAIELFNWNEIRKKKK